MCKLFAYISFAELLTTKPYMWQFPKFGYSAYKNKYTKFDELLVYEFAHNLFTTTVIS